MKKLNRPVTPLWVFGSLDHWRIAAHAHRAPTDIASD
jgi:hypothetical protein